MMMMMMLYNALQDYFAAYARPMAFSVKKGCKKIERDVGGGWMWHRSAQNKGWMASVRCSW
jgi:hypothetical protein